MLNGSQTPSKDKSPDAWTAVKSVAKDYNIPDELLTMWYVQLVGYVHTNVEEAMNQVNWSLGGVPITIKDYCEELSALLPKEFRVTVS